MADNRINNEISRDSELPAVSVVIITKDRREELNSCLQSFAELDYPQDRLEIIVVEETDGDEPIDAVNYISIPRHNRGWGYARNIGINNASYDLIGFVDDDCMVTKDWLKNLVHPLEDDVGGVTGGVLVKDSNAVGHSENVLGFPNGGLLRIHRAGNRNQETANLSTCNCLYRREVFEKVGYFYEVRKTRGTDMELAMRVTRQFRCLYAPQAVVYHKPRGSFLKVLKWFIERGKSQVLIAPHLIEKTKHVVFCIKNSISLRLGLLALLLYLTGPLRWYILLVLTLTYYSLNLARYSFQLKYLRRYDVLFLTPFVKLTMDIGNEIGQLHELIKILSKNLINTMLISVKLRR